MDIFWNLLFSKARGFTVNHCFITIFLQNSFLCSILHQGIFKKLCYSFLNLQNFSSKKKFVLPMDQRVVAEYKVYNSHEGNYTWESNFNEYRTWRFASAIFSIWDAFSFAIAAANSAFASSWIFFSCNSASVSCDLKYNFNYESLPVVISGQKILSTERN